MNTPEFIVIGLDGGSWEFLEPWLEAGDLPNLKDIRDNHKSGDLESCLPPVTSPNWKCYSTGLSPGNLGVYWWETLDWDNETIGTPSAGDYRGAELWEYLGSEQLRSLVVNMPTTYPPPDINGTVIAGGPTAGETGFTSPESLEEELREEYDYAPLPDSIDFIDSEPERVVEEIKKLLELRFTVAEDQLERESFDFVQVTLYLINVLQHHFGHREPVREAWELIDRKIGDWRDRFPDTPLVLVSDHGCNEIDVQFNVNEWLIENDYLRAGTSLDQTLLSSLGLNKDRIARWLAAVGLKKPLKSLLPKSLRNSLPTEDDSVMGPGKNRLIDWKATKAYAFGQGPVFVNPNQSEADLNATRDELEEKLEELTDPEGRSIATSVLKGLDYYGIDAEGTRPDLVVDQADGVHISNSIGFEDVFQRPDQWEAENAKQGLYAWVDPENPTTVENPDTPMKITDIMPSILAHLTGKVPENADGERRLKPDGAEAAQTISPTTVDRGETAGADETREKLEGLGYL